MISHFLHIRRNSIHDYKIYYFLFLIYEDMLSIKHKKKPKITSKARSNASQYSPPHRFTSYSTEDSHHVRTNPFSPEGKIFEEILQIKPYSILHKQESIDAKINEIMAIHTKSPQRTTFSGQKFEGKKQTTNLKLQCLQIIKYQSPRKGTNKSRVKFPDRIKDAKSSLQTYDDIQNEIAAQLISQCKRERKIFESTKTRLNKLIEQAEVQYARRQGFDINLDSLRKNGLRNFHKKERVCTQYHQTDQRPSQYFSKKQKVILDKNDFHTWLRTSNKLINMTKIDEQMRKSFHGDRINKNIIKNKNDFLYKRYFKKNVNMKTILSSALDLNNK